MDFNDPKFVMIAHSISLLVSFILLWSSWKKPKVAKILFALLFVWASWTNAIAAMSTPDFYLEYADYTFLPFYKKFILGVFSEHVILIVMTIASCQFLIGISMFFKGWIFRLGCIGGIIFLVSIAPLGVGAAFPATLIMASGLYLLFKRNSI